MVATRVAVWVVVMVDAIGPVKECLAINDARTRLAISDEIRVSVREAAYRDLQRTIGEGKTTLRLLLNGDDWDLIVATATKLREVKSELFRRLMRAHRSSSQRRARMRSRSDVKQDEQWSVRQKQARIDTLSTLWVDAANRLWYNRFKRHTDLGEFVSKLFADLIREDEYIERRRKAARRLLLKEKAGIDPLMTEDPDGLVETIQEEFKPTPPTEEELAGMEARHRVRPHYWKAMTHAERWKCLTPEELANLTRWKKAIVWLLGVEYGLWEQTGKVVHAKRVLKLDKAYGRILRVASSRSRGMYLSAAMWKRVERAEAGGERIGSGGFRRWKRARAKEVEKWLE